MSTKIWDSYDDEDSEPSAVECKHCGKGNLHWEDTDDGWQLYDAKCKKHVCPPTDVSSDFEVQT